MLSMVRPGDLRHRVQLVRDTSPKSPSGGTKLWSSFAVVATVAALVEPLQAGREVFGSPEWTVSIAAYVVWMYYRSDINEKMRVLWNNRQFDIRAIPTSDRSLVFMRVQCEEVK